MTRKDYVALAAALKDAQPTNSGKPHHEYGWWVWAQCMDAISAVLAADNPRFDRDRFVKACEGEKS